MLHKISINFIYFIDIQNYFLVYINLLKVKVKKHRTKLEKTKQKSELTKSLFFILTGKKRKLDLYKHAAIL